MIQSKNKNQSITENNTPNKDIEYIRKIAVTGKYSRQDYISWCFDKITTREFINKLNDYTKANSDNLSTDTNV